MGYKAVNVAGSNGSFSSVYTDRVSDDPGKLSDAVSTFAQTDIGKGLVEKGVDLTNYLRAREEYVILNIFRYFSRMAETPSSSDLSFAVERTDGSRTSYVLDNESALTIRQGISSSFSPIYKPFSLRKLSVPVFDLFDRMPKCNKKEYFQKYGTRPFVESEAAYRSGDMLLGYPASASRGTEYSRYIEYAVARLVKLYEKNYDKICRSETFDYMIVPTDPFFNGAESMLHDIDENNDLVVTGFYAVGNDRGIDFYADRNASGDPLFTYSYGLAGRSSYFTYTKPNGQIVRYGVDYGGEGKVIGGGSAGYAYSEPSFSVELDQSAYYGAEGARETDGNGDSRPGLLSIMGSFISDADARAFSRSFNPDAVYSKDMAQTLFDTMSWLYSEGYAFSVHSGKRADSSAVELSLDEMPGNQRIVFYPKDGTLAVRLESSMYNYEITDNPGVSVTDSTKLMLRYLRGELNGQSTALVKGVSSKARKSARGKDFSRSEVVIKGSDLIRAGLVGPDELGPDDDILHFRVFSEYSHFAPRLCYGSYTNGNGEVLDPEGAYRIQMYMVTAMQNFIGTMKFDELHEAVKHITDSKEATEEDLKRVAGLLSNDQNVSGLQKRYIMDLLDIYSYVDKAGMLDENDPVRVVPVSEFVQNLRSVSELPGADESYRLAPDRFIDDLTEQICKEQIGEIYDISGIDRDMLQAVWSDLSAPGQNTSDLTDEYGVYVSPSRVMDIDSEVFMFKENIPEGETIDMASRGNCRCRFYPGRFNAAGVLTYGRGNTSGVPRSALLAALIQMKYPSDRVFGDGELSASVMQRALIHFDEATVIDYENCNNEYEKHAMDVCRDALLANGAVEDADHPIKLSIDNQGIIRWTAYRPAVYKSKEFYQEITGEIGQVPLRDSDVRPGIGFDSIYRTRFGAGENFIFVPGYSAWLTTEGINDETATEENGFNMRDRLRVRGFNEIFENRIRQVVARQMVQPYLMDRVSTGKTSKNGKFETEPVGRTPICLDATALNDTYTKDTYGLRLETDFFDKSRLDISQEDPVHANAYINTMTSKVRFPTRMRDTNTTSAARRYAASKTYENSTFGTAEDFAFKLSGYKSMRIVPEAIWGGVFDTRMIGSDSMQGLSLYLADGAKVENGRIVPVEYDRDVERAPGCALANMDEFRFIENDMVGRTRMVSNQLMGAKRIVRDINVAYSTFYGWTFDDAYVVSKEFADKYAILNSEGEERSLVKGDKLSDFGGNKGVISLVVDRNWSSEDLDRICKDDPYKREMYEKALKFFRENPTLEVVGSPFGPMSRDNTSVIMKGLEAREHGSAESLVHPDGHSDGSLVRTDFIIPHQTVDEKTTIYEEAGEGRKVSSQLAWAMTAKGAHKLISELFSDNAYAWSDLREYFIATGLDLTEDGTILTGGYQPYKVPVSENTVATTDEADMKDEERVTFVIDQPVRDEEGNIVALNAKRRDLLLSQFKNDISISGGFLLVPSDFAKLPDDVKARAEALGLSTDVTIPSFYGDSNGSAESRKDIPIVTGEDGKEYYRVPILPPHLRKDAKNLDGMYTTHDFTLQYESMYDAVLQWYTFASKAFENQAELDDDEFARTLSEARMVGNYFSSNFDSIQATIIQKFNGKGTGKYSYFRDELQGVRIPNSATSVFMPDPTLPIGEVAMDAEVMASLNVKDGEKILVWRDPVLRDGALRCVTARLDPSIHGVSMNPFCDYSMDGDFDGDTLGMIKIPKDAKEEAERLFGYGDNLLEFGAEPKEVDGKKNSPLYFNFSMDVKTAEAAVPSLATEHEEIEREANNLVREIREAGADERKIRAQQDALVGRLTQYSRDVYRAAGDHMHTIDFTSKETVFDSFRRMALDGSKGNASKLYDLLQYAGWEAYDAKTGKSFEAELSKKGTEEFDKWFASFRPKIKGSEHPFVGSDEIERCHEASSIKTDDTGSAGTKSQKAMAALREICPDAALNVTYNVTQALLQIKKDPVMAHRMDTLVCTDMATLFGGTKPRCFYDDPKAKLEKITTEKDFADTFYHLITDKDKMDLSVARSEVDRIAKGLVVDGEFYAPDDYLERFGSVLDYISYGSDGKERRCFDMLCTLDGKNFHQTIDGKPAPAASSFVPEKVSVCRDVDAGYEEVLRDQFADKLGIKTERLNKAANEAKRTRELQKEINDGIAAMKEGAEKGAISRGQIKAMGDDIRMKQKNLDELVAKQDKRADTKAYTDALNDKIVGE